MVTNGTRRQSAPALEEPRTGLHDEVGEVIHGHRAGALLIGVGGSGKTHVLRGQAAAARRGGVSVLEVRGVKDSGAVWLASAGSSDVPPTALAGMAAPDLAQHICAALAGDGVLIADDAHWLDEETVTALTFVARDLAPSGVRMLVATRIDHHRPELELLVDALTLINPPIQLGRYSETVASEVARRHLSPLAGGMAEAMVSGADRLPALVHALAGMTLDEPDHVQQWLTRGVCPPPVVAWVRPRLRRLSAAARRAVGLHAFGISTSDEALHIVIRGEGEGSVLEARDELRAEGLLSEHGDDLIPLVSQACLEVLDPGERTALHRAVASALDACGAPPSQWARHLQMGLAAPGEVAAACLQAADECLSGAPLSALSWLDNAEAAGADDDAVAVRRVEAFVRSGQPVEAIRAAEPLGRSTEPAHLVARMHLSVSYLHARMPHQAAQVMLQLRDDVEHEPSAALAQVAAGLFRLDAGHLDDAEQLLAGQRERAAEDLTLGLACDVADSVLAVVRDNDIDAALVKAARATDLEMAAHACHELPTSAATVATMLSLLAFDFAGAGQIARRVLDEPAASPTQRQRRALRADLVGVMAGAKSTRSRSEQLPEAPSDRMLAVAAAAGAARRANDLTRLRQLQLAIFDVLRQPPDLVFLPAYAEVMIAAARLGAMSHVVAAREACRRVLAEHDPRHPVGAYLCWIDFQCAVVSDGVFDAEAFLDAVGALDVGGNQRVVAEVMSTWARLALGHAGPAEVIASADRLHALSMGAEATRLVGAAAARFADDASTKTLLVYARSHRRPATTLTTADVALTSALSPREREVAVLIVDGLRYKEIGAELYISPKTVEHHVARIRQRIGVDNRADMLAVLRAELRGSRTRQTS